MKFRIQNEGRLKGALVLSLCVISVSIAEDFDDLPPNEWTLIHEEPDNSGGKEFAKAVYAPNVDKVFLWGTGGEKPHRNVYKRFELESFAPAAAEAGWAPAFPESKRDVWTADDFPPFRIYGQSGPDGLKYDEGPRQRVVGGYHFVNRVQWWDFDGVTRPSPVLTFNQACWDSKRERILYHSDGQMIALDPKTNSWTNLETPNFPRFCKAVAWASMAYDSGRDRVIFFGGGLATNLSGAAPTWIYDCAENSWSRPDLEAEPPPRCNGAMVYDSATESIVLFGGNNQAAALNDVHIFDCKTDQWHARLPEKSPPPMFEPGAVSLGGRMIVCGNDARKIELAHQFRSSAIKETWAYDVSANSWTPVHAGLDLNRVRWLSLSRCSRDDVALMVAFGPKRQTWAMRFDPGREQADLAGVADVAVAWKYPEQKESLENAPPPDPTAHAEFIADLPPNEFVNAEPPGMLISKTWSTATIDTDLSEVVYHGGGHSGYSGNDFARYNIATNRWTLDAPPRFPPFLEGTNAGIYGWSYGMIPFSQHTYLWYCYDPVSKNVIYLARPSIEDGVEVELSSRSFIYSAEQHGYASWIYDSAARRMRGVSFGRPFKNPWHLALCGTLDGVFCAVDRKLYRGLVDAGEVEWSLVDEDFPAARGEPIKYHYEFQPLLFDSKRNRLIQLKGDQARVDVFARPMDESASWSQLETTGSAAIGREAVYIEKHDTILWLADKQLFAFDCETNQLSELAIDLPEGSYTHECAMVYDPKHDVCVALIPSRFSGPMQTFLFRYAPDLRN